MTYSALFTAADLCGGPLPVMDPKKIERMMYLLDRICEAAEKSVASYFGDDGRRQSKMVELTAVDVLELGSLLTEYFARLRQVYPELQDLHNRFGKGA